MIYPRVTAVMIGKEIMMEGCILSTPDATVAMYTLSMNGVAETLRQDAPLHGKEFICIE